MITYLEYDPRAGRFYGTWDDGRIFSVSEDAFAERYSLIGRYAYETFQWNEEDRGVEVVFVPEPTYPPPSLIEPMVDEDGNTIE